MKDLLNNKKKLYPYLIAIGIFIILTLTYMSPMLKGYDLDAGDTRSWEGMSREVIDYHDSTGIWSGWTNSMFSGMPTYTIAYEFPSATVMVHIANIFHLGMPSSMYIVFTYLLCGFLLLKSLKIDTRLSIAGAIALAFSSYFFIIIQAGHSTKAHVIGCMMGVIAGFIFIFQQRKYILGAVITMFFMALQFWLSHVQMTYYFFMMIGILLITEIFTHIKERKIKNLLISICIFGAAVLVGVGTSYSFLKTTQNYAKETMRGGHSELKGDSNNKTTGLDLDYATQWSYGIDETMTLLIPDFKGGSSNARLGESSHLYETMVQQGVPKNEAKKYAGNAPTYWGTQPFTSGPVYVGAIVFFLFVLALFLVKSPYKWALLIAALFSILLAWGRNFMWLTEFFMNYFPMYSKFRAVSSILVVAEVCIPVLAFLGLKAIMDGEDDKKFILKKIKLSTFITGGICLFFLLFGGVIYDFTSPNDSENFRSLPQWFIDAIIADRASMFRMDALRSLILILLAAIALFFWVKGKLKANYFYIIITALVLFDMWSIDKRYFNNDDFTVKKNIEIPFQMSQADQLILQDSDPHYRVLNVTTNTFNDAATSYFHKSIGGYSPAKLRRYQDMIEHHIAKNNMNVINMLNTKYFIVPGQTGEPIVQLNPMALGNAWFVDSVRVVEGPDAEIDALDAFDPTIIAIVDTPFMKWLDKFTPVKDSASTIHLISYKPNELRYKAEVKKNELAVFSEVYYADGWKAYIDNQLVDILRVNYVLRALTVPEGEHVIRFVFEPTNLKKDETISSIFVWIFVLSLVGGIVYSIVLYRKKQTQQNNKN